MNSTQEKVRVKNGREAADKSVGEGPEKKKTKFDAKPRANEIIWTDLVEELKEGVRNQKKNGIPKDPNNPFGFSDIGLPKQLTFIAPPGPGKAWSFFHRLEKKIIEYTKPSGFGGMRSFCTSKGGKKIYTHVCKLCLAQANEVIDPLITSGKTALKNVSNTDNGESHLRSKHKSHPDVIQFLIGKSSGEQSGGALDSGVRMRNVKNSLITSQLKQAKDHKTRILTAKWLINNHLGHSITQSDEFRKLQEHLDPSYVPLARSTFVSIVEDMFASMVAGITKLLGGESS